MRARLEDVHLHPGVDVQRHEPPGPVEADAAGDQVAVVVEERLASGLLGRGRPQEGVAAARGDRAAERGARVLDREPRDRGVVEPGRLLRGRAGGRVLRGQREAAPVRPREVPGEEHRRAPPPRPLDGDRERIVLRGAGDADRRQGDRQDLAEVVADGDVVIGSRRRAGDEADVDVVAPPPARAEDRREASEEALLALRREAPGAVGRHVDAAAQDGERVDAEPDREPRLHAHADGEHEPDDVRPVLEQREHRIAGERRAGAVDRLGRDLEAEPDPDAILGDAAERQGHGAADHEPARPVGVGLGAVQVEREVAVQAADRRALALDEREPRGVEEGGVVPLGRRDARPRHPGRPAAEPEQLERRRARRARPHARRADERRQRDRG
ncbi:MAG: hypothetical protein K8M05_29350 [Deltaproteobacteria bacterium]|nr:hypothetical protein [Kofleriaceae bacterium]